MLVVTWISLILLVFSVSSQGCSSGWFGSQCQYKCHCNSSASCDGDGQCSDGRCVGGWFGPACQFADLAFQRSTNETSELTDGDDNSCVPSSVSGSVTVTLNNSYPFSWLRVHYKNAGILNSLKVSFNSGVSCNNSKIAIVDDKTLDIHCDMNERVQSVTLTGEGVQYLCSLYISGGRNVALRQNTTQSSDFTEKANGVTYRSYLAVDGNPNTNFTAGGSCTHTRLYLFPPAIWTLILSKPENVNRFVLFNREEASGLRLKNFILTTFDASGVVVFNYTDTDPEARLVYTVIPVKNFISKMTVQSNNPENILTLCEVEVYGDSVCEPKWYGRDCEHRCNCAGDGACFVSTGGCPSGCPIGIIGESCNKMCGYNTWGSRCSQNCSFYCATPALASEALCNNVNGDCTRGCKDGYRGSKCTEECEGGKFGPDCAFTCSKNCVSISNSRSCNTVDGACVNGCIDGYMGDNCTSSCTPGKYGPNCINNCRDICLAAKNTSQTSCDPVSGNCLYGCLPGYTGPICLQARTPEYVISTPARMPEDHALITGLIVGICIAGVAVVVMAVIVAVILCRRSSEQRSPYNDTNNSEQDIHEYVVPKLEGDDDYVLPVGKSDNPVEGAAATRYQNVKPRIELRSDTQPQADAENVDRIYDAI